MAACIGLYHLFVDHGRLLLRLEAIEARDPSAHGSEDAVVSGMAKGSVLPDFSLDDLAGRTKTLSQWRGERLLLTFVDLDCEFSRELMIAWAGAAGTAPRTEVSPIVVCRSDADATRSFFERHPLTVPVLIDSDSAVSALLGVRYTPAGYIVDENGVTSSELLTGGEELTSALAAADREYHPQGGVSRFSRSTERSRLVRDGLPAGTTAPSWSLPDLEGRTVSLSDFLGAPLLLVFSDPECRPCQTLAPRLQRIHRRGTAPSIVMISRGDLEANRRKAAEHDLSFPIVRQRHWEVSRAYGMFATPIGYLIDSEGSLASRAAVGAEAVLQLIADGNAPPSDARRMEFAS